MECQKYSNTELQKSYKCNTQQGQTNMKAVSFPDSRAYFKKTVLAKGRALDKI